MGQNEMNKYEFDMLAHTPTIADIIHNRLEVTTDTTEDFERAYNALCESVTDGMFYLRHIKEGVDHLYFTVPADRVRFIDAISAL